MGATNHYVDSGHPSGKRVVFEIGHGIGGPSSDPTMSGRQSAVCIACGAVATRDHIKAEAMAGHGRGIARNRRRRMRQRVYVQPTDQHYRADRSHHRSMFLRVISDGILAITPPLRLDPVVDLFTNRQLMTMAVLSDLVKEARERVLDDALTAGAPRGERLELGGTDVEAYADAVSTYLALALDKHADYGNSLVAWYPQEDRRATYSPEAP